MSGNSRPASLAHYFILILSFVAVVLSFGQAVAADEDFYKGKRITIVVSTPPAGGYDVYARILSEYLPKYVPGNPAVVVQNMGGAAGLQASNYMYSQAPRDGTVIAATHSSIPTSPQFSPDAAKFDVNKISWIGSVTSDPFVSYVWHASAIKSFEDIKTKEVIMGGAAVGSASIDFAIVAREMFGLKIKIITGYANSPDVKLAMEKGELDGSFGNSWSDLKQTQPTWVPEGKVRMMTQFGSKRHPELQDVYLFQDLAKNDADKQALSLLFARQDFGKPYWAPPEVPSERLTILRRAFDAIIKDPQFIAACNKIQLPVEAPLTGEALSAQVMKLSQTSEPVVQRLQAMFKNFKQ